MAEESFRARGISGGWVGNREPVRRALGAGGRVVLVRGGGDRDGAFSVAVVNGGNRKAASGLGHLSRMPPKGGAATYTLRS